MVVVKNYPRKIFQVLCERAVTRNGLPCKTKQNGVFYVMRVEESHLVLSLSNPFFYASKLVQTMPQSEENCVKLVNRSVTYLSLSFAKCLTFWVWFGFGARPFTCITTDAAGASGGFGGLFHASLFFLLLFFGGGGGGGGGGTNLSVDQPAFLQIGRW